MEYPTINQELELGTVLWEQGTMRIEGKRGTFVNVRCHTCGIPRPVATVDTRRQSGECLKCRTHKHYKNLNKGGELASRYKGRKRTNDDGYHEIALYPGDEHYDLFPVWRSKGKVKYVAEHRYVMFKKLGRPLRTWEHVHHIDGIKTNNHPDNLIIVDSETHSAITALMKENNALRTELSALHEEIAYLRSRLE